jgi:hypothetical protein
MFAFDAVDVLGEAILDCSQRLRRHGYNCATETIETQPRAGG